VHQACGRIKAKGFATIAIGMCIQVFETNEHYKFFAIC
jgi:hypothetical protein